MTHLDKSKPAINTRIGSVAVWKVSSELSLGGWGAGSPGTGGSLVVHRPISGATGTWNVLLNGLGHFEALILE